MKKAISLISVLTVIICLCGCSSSGGKESPSFYDEYPTGDEIQTVEIEKNPVATITMADDSKITIELEYYNAPNAVADFIALAGEGIYDSMAFNELRGVKNGILMLGNSDGSEFSPPYFVMDENGNNASHESMYRDEGVVAMQRMSSGGTVTGQFLVVVNDGTFLNSGTTVFGKVTEGMDVIKKIASGEISSDDGLIKNPGVIKSVSVETFGVKFPNPTIIPNK